mgnify:CR=1 FL=1
MSFLVANVPPVKVLVKKQYLYDLEKGHGEYTEGLWVTCKSIQGRALYFETYLPEYGALYDKLPISAFVSEPTDLDLPLEDLALRNALSWLLRSFNILLLDNKHFAAQPNNRCLFYDKSLSPAELKTPDFKVSTVEYNVETESKWTAGDDTHYFYDLKEQK